jgi:hypothetical protein
MPMANAPLGATSSLCTEEDDDSQGVLGVHNCNRLGRTANPPGCAFTRWRWFPFWR